MIGRRPRPPRPARALVVATLAAVAGAAALAGVPAGTAADPPAPAPRAAPCATPEGEVAVGQVQVVVAFPSRTATACAAPGGSGIDVLQRAGFGVVLSSYGSVGGRAAVCAITDPASGEQVGCQTGPSCLTCAAPDAWTYYRCWQYSQVGAGSTAPAGGSVEAWHFGHSRTWPGSRAPACDRDGDDTVPTPTSRPPSGGGPTGGPTGGGGPGGPAGGSPSGPGGPTGGPSGPGATDPIDPADPSSPDDPSGDPARPGEPTTAGTGSSTSVAGGPSSDRAGGRGGDQGGGPAVEDDRIAASGPRPGTAPGGGGGGGGGAVVPLVVTAGLVAVLGAVALRVRRRRSPSATP